MRNDAVTVSVTIDSIPSTGVYCYPYSSEELGGVDSSNFNGLGLRLASGDGLSVGSIGAIMEDDTTVHCWDNCNCFIDHGTIMPRALFEVGESPCFTGCNVESIQFTIHSTQITEFGGSVLITFNFASGGRTTLPFVCEIFQTSDTCTYWQHDYYFDAADLRSITFTSDSSFDHDSWGVDSLVLDHYDASKDHVATAFPICEEIVLDWNPQSGADSYGTWTVDVAWDATCATDFLAKSCPGDSVNSLPDVECVDECAGGCHTCVDYADGYTCACDAGWYEVFTTVATCEECPANTWSTSGADTCTPCAADASAPAGSSTCTCNDGYTGDGVTSCIATLLLHYKFDDGANAGTSVADSALGENHGTTFDTVTWITDDCVYDGCIRFSSAGCVHAPAYNVLFPFLTSPTGTVSFWAKGDASLPAASSLMEWAGADNNNELIFRPAWDNGETYFAAGNGGLPSQFVSKVSDASHYEATWHHVALTFDLSAGNMAMFVDGSAWMSKTGATIPFASLDGFNIGCGLYDGADSYYYAGSLDDLRVYSYVLSDAEITAAMNDDECGLAMHNCDGNADCINTDGSFACRCNSGYTGDGLSCEVGPVLHYRFE
eukprot:Rmarinus@m.8811